MSGSSHFIDLTVDDDDDHDFTARSSRTAINEPRPQTLQLGSVIELTDSSDESDVNLKTHADSISHSRDKRHRRQKKLAKAIQWLDDEIIELSSSPEISPVRGKGKGKAKEYQATSDLEDEALARRLAREEDINGSNDEIVELSSSPVASPTKAKAKAQIEHREHCTLQGEALARLLAQEYEETIDYRSARDIAEDERLARQLAEEEERSFRQLVATVEEKEEGIVFSVVVNAADNTLHDGSPAHPDDLERFEPWKKLCEVSGLKVKKFHWFVNYELEKRFEAARGKLEQVMGQRPEELQLFHGTAAPNIDSILNGGFRIGGVGGQPVVNGVAHGYGIYFAAHPATSLGYALGGNKIFACRVVPGRITQSPINSPPRSLEIGSEGFECYSSGTGIYVHRFSSLVLPCYMVEFDMPNNPMATRMGVQLPMLPAKFPVALGAGYTAAAQRSVAPLRRR